MSSTTETPGCAGDPSNCSFCNPSANTGACAMNAIPGCTTSPKSCEVCKNGNGCCKDCTGNPSTCRVCEGKSCIKPAEASFGVEPARPK